MLTNKLGDDIKSDKTGEDHPKNLFINEKKFRMTWSTIKTYKKEVLGYYVQLKRIDNEVKVDIMGLVKSNAEPIMQFSYLPERNNFLLAIPGKFANDFSQINKESTGINYGVSQEEERNTKEAENRSLEDADAKGFYGELLIRLEHLSDLTKDFCLYNKVNESFN